MTTEELAAKAAADAALLKAAEDATAVATKSAEDAATKAADELAALQTKLDAALVGEGTSEEEAKLLKEVMKRKDSEKSVKAELATKQAELDKLTNALGGLEISDISEIIDGQKKAATKKLEDEGKYKQIIESMGEQHTKAVEDMKATIDALNVDLKTATSSQQELTIGRAFGDSAFVRESSTLPVSIARATFEGNFDIENGTVVAYNKPKGVEGRAPLVDADGSGKSFEDAIKQLYNDHPDNKTLLKTKQKQGAGSSTDVSKSIAQNDDKVKFKGLDRIANALNKNAAAS